MKRLALILAGLCASIANAQTPVALAPVPHQQFFAANGTPLAGGFVYTYVAGTSTPLATYLDSQGLFQNTNPIVLDAGGFATIYVTSASYKFCVANASNVQQWCQDNITAVVQPFTSLSWNNGGSFLGTLFQSNTANRTYSFPDFSGTVALLQLAQTWTATQTFQGLQFTGGGANLGILTHSNSATRTYTFPDATGTVCLIATCPLASPTITMPSIVTPTITAGGSWAGSPTINTPVLTSPTVTGNLSLSFNTGCLSGTQFQAGLLTCYNGQSTVNNGIETEVAQVFAQAQTAAIAATNVYPGPVAIGGGLFLVRYEYFLETSTAGGAGTVSVTFTWPKVLSTQTFTSATCDLTVLGKYITGQLFIVTNNQTLSPVPVQYSTTFTGTTTAAYNLYITAEKF